MVNRVELSGELLAKGALRHTPAGIPVLEFSLAHLSRQDEAGKERRVECEVSCVAMGIPSGLVNAAKLGDQLTVCGFMAAKSLKTRALVLHVTDIEFLEGNEHGIQT